VDIVLLLLSLSFQWHVPYLDEQNVEDLKMAD
jgi:hypothetical protein